MSHSTHARHGLGAKTYWIMAGSIVGGMLLGMGLQALMRQDQAKCLSDLDFIKPSLDCAISDEKAEQMSRLQAKLDALVPVYIQNKKAEKIGVFVRDLRSTRFAGINDSDSFVMASLLKVPLLVAGYKLAEVEPKILDQQIQYTGVPDLYAGQSFRTDDRLIANRSYTIRELMRRSTELSDNTAAELLSQAYPVGFLDRILRALGLQVKLDSGSEENFTTPDHTRTSSDPFTMHHISLKNIQMPRWKH